MDRMIEVDEGLFAISILRSSDAARFIISASFTVIIGDVTAMLMVVIINVGIQFHPIKSVASSSVKSISYSRGRVLSLMNFTQIAWKMHNRYETDHSLNRNRISP
jgi:hypothetical protein